MSNDSLNIQLAPTSSVVEWLEEEKERPQYVPPKLGVSDQDEEPKDDDDEETAEETSLSEKCPIDSIPDEILMVIFRSPRLDSYDLLSLASTCRRFRAIMTDGDLWSKAAARTPIISKCSCHSRIATVEALSNRYKSFTLDQKQALKMGMTPDEYYDAKMENFSRAQAGGFHSLYEIAALVVLLLGVLLGAARLDHLIDGPWVALLVPLLLAILIFAMGAVSFTAYYWVFQDNMYDEEDKGHMFHGGLLQYFLVAKPNGVGRHPATHVLYFVMSGCLVLQALFIVVRACTSAMPVTVLLLPAALMCLLVCVALIARLWSPEHNVILLLHLLPGGLMAASFILLGVQLDHNTPFDWWVPVGVFVAACALCACNILCLNSCADEAWQYTIGSWVVVPCLIIAACLEAPLLNGTYDWSHMAILSPLYVLIASALIANLSCVPLSKTCNWS